MDKRPGRLAIAAAAMVAAVLLSSCTASVPEDKAALQPKPVPTVQAGNPGTTLTAPEDVAHYAPAGEKVISFLDNQSTAGSLGQFDVTSKFIKVYLTCFGPGQVTIKVDNVGGFPLPCSQSDIAPSENQFEVSAVKSYGVTIDSAKGQHWAATLALTDNG